MCVCVYTLNASADVRCVRWPCIILPFQHGLLSLDSMEKWLHVSVQHQFYWKSSLLCKSDGHFPLALSNSHSMITSFKRRLQLQSLAIICWWLNVTDYVLSSIIQEPTKC